jgi:DNA-binding MarR family transcriptional regulator
MAPRLPLSALLSQVLISFTLEDERHSPVSVAMWSNVLRLLDEEGVDKRRLPALSGVSKQAIHMLVGCLERQGHVVIEPDPADSRAELVCLTPRGRRCEEAFAPLLDGVEARWQERYGKDEMLKLREALEALVSDLDVELPHYPIVMPHRGGHPTG